MKTTAVFLAALSFVLDNNVGFPLLGIAAFIGLVGASFGIFRADALSRSLGQVPTEKLKQFTRVLLELDQYALGEFARPGQFDGCHPQTFIIQNELRAGVEVTRFGGRITRRIWAIPEHEASAKALARLLFDQTRKIWKINIVPPEFFVVLEGIEVPV